jgi:hypothetical protein
VFWLHTSRALRFLLHEGICRGSKNKEADEHPNADPQVGKADAPLREPIDFLIHSWNGCEQEVEVSVYDRPVRRQNEHDG